MCLVFSAGLVLAVVGICFSHAASPKVTAMVMAISFSNSPSATAKRFTDVPSCVGLIKEEFLKSESGQAWSQQMQAKGMNPNQTASLIAGQVADVIVNYKPDAMQNLSESEKVLLATILHVSKLDLFLDYSWTWTISAMMAVSKMDCQYLSDRAACTLTLPIPHSKDSRSIGLLWQRGDDSIQKWKLAGVVGLLNF